MALRILCPVILFSRSEVNHALGELGCECDLPLEESFVSDRVNNIAELLTLAAAQFHV